METMEWRVLIIEDDQRVAELTKKALTNNGYTVDSAFDGEQGLSMGLKNNYDLVITDIILPKMDGVTICKALRAQNQDLPILMLTALGTTDDKVEGFDSGADDYLVKPFEMRELLARIKVLIKRSKIQQLLPDKLVYADIELDTVTKEVKRNGVLIHLTPKEFNLLEFMMRHPERVLSKPEIAEKVWDTHFDTGTNFIDVYINYLRKKIDKNFEHKLIHTKQGMGFMLMKK
ncbi:MAG: response regulator transcription factor [Crocinitomicaceae bacterium]|nr:response regulator transcription factor [Crocinitomicaceae bacterium]